MRAINKYSSAGLLSLMIILMMVSCKKRDIKGEVIAIGNVKASLKSNDGEILIPEDSSYAVSSEYLTVTLEAAFSDVVTERFKMNVGVDNDTINSMIADNKLPNTVLLPSKSYKIPSSLDAKYGLGHLKFNIVIDINTVERNYGKNLALAVVLGDPSKGNTLNKNKAEAVVVINTAKVLKPEQVHYIYFKQAGNTEDLPEQGTTYLQTATSVTVPETISLGGTATGAFKVALGTDADTVQKLIAANKLTNTIPLTEGDYTMPSSVDFDAGKNEASFDLNINSAVLSNNEGKKMALALTLSDPTNHLVDSTRKTVILVIDPAKLLAAIKYIPENSPIIITGFLANPRGSDEKIAGSVTKYAGGVTIVHKGGYEYIQLMALEDIDFSKTPYSVVTCNNGSATENGWAEGGARTFKFDLTKGFAAKGTFFYVGAAAQVICAYWPDGLSTDISGANWIRTIQVDVSNADSVTGDGFGLSTAGFLGNSNPTTGSADGIAVFKGTEVTPATVPLDAVFFNPPVGNTLQGLKGYLIPQSSDLYSAVNPKTGEPQPLFGEGTNTAAAEDAGSNNQFTVMGGIISDKGWIIPRSPSSVILSRTSQLSDIESGPKITVFKK